MEASTTNNNSSNQLIKQIVDDLKSSSSILITIPKSPSIDQLCAAISIHLTLHQLNKNITTIFTGAIPNILTFLHPEKIFEDNIDSLRDFVIYFNATKAKQVQFKKDGDIIKVATIVS
jgi:nanoRNase/pAp phosphatase (c-di-AMP/oligoRNAs hydrolase)